MKILQINTCHYLRGGSETVYFNTSKILKDHGHEIAFFSAKDSRNIPNEFEPYFIPYENIRELSTIRKISKMPDYLYNKLASNNLELLLNNFKPDIAHVHLFYGVLSVSILKTLKKHKIPVVHTVHDFKLLCPVSTFLTKNDQICESCRGGRFFYCLKKRCSEGKLTQSGVVMLEAYFWKYFIDPVDYIDHIIFVSKFFQRKHIEFDSRYNFMSSQLYNFTFNIKKSNNCIKGDYFFYYGRLSPEKGIKVLLDMFIQTNYKLKIAGTGPLLGIVEDCTNKNTNIEYLGFRTGEDLTDLIHNALFVIVPSVCYENNPMTIIESFSLGKPVIGSATGGIPELIKHDENGYLFNPGDSQSLAGIIEKAANISDSEYLQFSAASEKFAQDHFDTEKHYLELLNIYQNVIIKSSGSGTIVLPPNPQFYPPPDSYRDPQPGEFYPPTPQGGLKKRGF